MTFRVDDGGIMTRRNTRLVKVPITDTVIPVYIKSTQSECPTTLGLRQYIIAGVNFPSLLSNVHKGMILSIFIL